MFKSSDQDIRNSPYQKRFERLSDYVMKINPNCIIEPLPDGIIIKFSSSIFDELFFMYATQLELRIFSLSKLDEKTVMIFKENKVIEEIIEYKNQSKFDKKCDFQCNIFGEGDAECILDRGHKEKCEVVYEHIELKISLKSIFKNRHQKQLYKSLKHFSKKFKLF